jgi:hypothetical protein
LPDAESYRAWSNCTFTADTGHVYEVDLLVAARSGLFLIAESASPIWRVSPSTSPTPVTSIYLTPHAPAIACRA